MSESSIELLVAFTAILFCGLIGYQAYGRRLDDLICTPDGRISPAKIGTLVGGAAWTYYMVTRLPDAVEMWLAYYCAVAVTELFKKFLTMYFNMRTGGAVDSTVKTTDSTVTTKTTATTTP